MIDLLFKHGMMLIIYTASLLFVVINKEKQNKYLLLFMLTLALFLFYAYRRARVIDKYNLTVEELIVWSIIIIVALIKGFKSLKSSKITVESVIFLLLGGIILLCARIAVEEAVKAYKPSDKYYDYNKTYNNTRTRYQIPLITYNLEIDEYYPKEKVIYTDIAYLESHYRRLAKYETGIYSNGVKTKKRILQTHYLKEITHYDADSIKFEEDAYLCTDLATNKRYEIYLISFYDEKRTKHLEIYEGDKTIKMRNITIKQLDSLGIKL